MKSPSFWMLALAVLALAGAGGALTGAAGPQVAAHRGGALLWPENSLTAHRNALALGVAYVETDVHLTADGEVIVLHDPTLDRTTTGAGPVRAARLADLGGVRLTAPDGGITDEPIPTLARLLDLLAPGRAGLLLEIKVDDRGRRYPGIEERVLALVRAHGLDARTLVMAFQPETLVRVRELDPTMRTVLLIGRGQAERERVWPAESLRRAVGLGAAAIGYDYRLVDHDIMVTAHRAGLLVGAWTVNQEAHIRRVVELGVDIIISDRPDLALRLVGGGR